MSKQKKTEKTCFCWCFTSSSIYVCLSFTSGTPQGIAKVMKFGKTTEGRIIPKSTISSFSQSFILPDGMQGDISTPEDFRRAFSLWRIEIAVKWSKTNTNLQLPCDFEDSGVRAATLLICKVCYRSFFFSIQILKKPAIQIGASPLSQMHNWRRLEKPRINLYKLASEGCLTISIISPVDIIHQYSYHAYHVSLVHHVIHVYHLKHILFLMQKTHTPFLHPKNDHEKYPSLHQHSSFKVDPFPPQSLSAHKLPVIKKKRTPPKFNPLAQPTRPSQKLRIAPTFPPSSPSQPTHFHRRKSTAKLGLPSSTRPP